MSPWLSDLYLSAQSDSRLLALSRDGHGRAFAIIVERYRSELLAQARRLVGSAGAEDLVQQTLLNAFTAIAAGAEVRHLRGWLYTILRHAALRASVSLDASLEDVAVPGDPLELLVERRAQARSVLSAVESLPSRQRQVLLGSSLQGLSRAELAASLGVSEGAVRQLLHRAGAALRTTVTALTPYQLARWAAGSGGHSGGPEAAAGAGAVSAGGLLAKAGAIAAAGALATGVALEIHPAHRPSGAAHVRIHGDRGAKPPARARGPILAASASPTAAVTFAAERPGSANGNGAGRGSRSGLAASRTPQTGSVAHRGSPRFNGSSGDGSSGAQPSSPGDSGVGPGSGANGPSQTADGDSESGSSSASGSGSGSGSGSDSSSSGDSTGSSSSSGGPGSTQGSSDDGGSPQTTSGSSGGPQSSGTSTTTGPLASTDGGDNGSSSSGSGATADGGKTGD